MTDDVRNTAFLALYCVSISVPVAVLLDGEYTAQRIALLFVGIGGVCLALILLSEPTGDFDKPKYDS